MDQICVEMHVKFSNFNNFFLPLREHTLVSLPHLFSRNEVISPPLHTYFMLPVQSSKPTLYIGGGALPLSLKSAQRLAEKFYEIYNETNEPIVILLV